MAMAAGDGEAGNPSDHESANEKRASGAMAAALHPHANRGSHPERAGFVRPGRAGPFIQQVSRPKMEPMWRK